MPQEHSGARREGEYKRVLGPVSLILLGVGGIIGTGISVVTGIAAAKHAGPALIISFTISGFVAVLTALCYAELASAIPKSGGAYNYVRTTMGNFPGWIVGWFLILEYVMGASAVAVGWSAYLESLLRSAAHIQLDPAISVAPFAREHGAIILTGSIINLPAALLVVVLSIPTYFGIRQSSVINAVVTIAKVGVILLVIFYCVGSIDVANWHPFIPANQGTFGEFGWSGILRASALVFFAYIGFDTVTTLSQESRRPERDIPIGLIGSVLICLVIYALVAIVITGVVHYSALNVADPLFVLVHSATTAPSWLGPIVSMGALVGLASVTFVTLVGLPRILRALADDGFLPRSCARIHPAHGTPHVSTFLTAAATATVSGMFPLDILGELVSMGTLLAFAFVCISVIVLRRRDPHLPRTFRVPLYPWVPIFGLISCVGLMAALPLNTWLRLTIWLALGVTIYIAHGRRASRRAAGENR